MIMVRKNELACRDEWSHDLWEVRTGTADASPASFVVPFPTGPVQPATQVEIAAVLRADTVAAHLNQPATDVLLSEIGGAAESTPIGSEPGPPPTSASSLPEESPAARAVQPSDTFERSAVRRAHETFREHTRAASRPMAGVDSPATGRDDAVPTLIQGNEPVAGIANDISDDGQHDSVESADEAVLVGMDFDGWADSSAMWPEEDEPRDEIRDSPRGRSAADDAHSSGDADSDDVAAYNNTYSTADSDTPDRGFRFADLFSWRPGMQQRSASSTSGSAQELPATENWESELDAPEPATTGPYGRPAREERTATLASQENDKTLLAGQTASTSGLDGLPTERRHRDVSSAPSVHEAAGEAVAAPTPFTGEPVAQSEHQEFPDGLAIAGDPAFVVPSWFPDDPEAIAVHDEAEIEGAAVATPMPGEEVDRALPRALHGPRQCRACRDFRPADGGERGWCGNPWAFSYRRMVEGEDVAPCAAAFGDWWLPKDVIWLDSGDISAHGLATPLLDAFVPDHRPEAPARRRR